MKRILIVAGEYYPHETPCCFRMRSFAKYLPEFGFDPVVFSAIPSSDFRNPMGYFTPGAVNENVEDICETHRFPLKHRFEPPSIRRWLGLYFGKGTFARAYIRTALRMHKQCPFDLVLATQPGEGASLWAASKIAAQLGIPFVADFRDVCIQHTAGVDPGRRTRPWKERLSIAMHDSFIRRWARYEAVYATAADQVYTVSEALCGLLRDHYGVKDPKLLINGYDDEAYDAVSSEPAKDLFRIVYTGALHYEQDPWPFIRALENLVQRDERWREKCRVLLYGVQREKLVGLPASLEPVVEFNDRVPKSDIIRITKSAAVLLHFSHRGSKGIMTSKLTEYLGAERPILSVPGDGDVVEQFLKKTQAGLCLGETEDIEAFLTRQFDSWEETGKVIYQPDREVFDQYTRRAQARILASGLHDLVEVSS